MAVLDVRGTHGSGKSWLMHSLLRMFPHEPILEGGRHIGYHLVGPDAALLGRYDNQCGGCDGIGTAGEVVRRVRLFSGLHRHVLLEGILVSHTYKRYDALAVELAARGYTFLFLNTPLKTCIARVMGRRARRGDRRPFNPKSVIHDWHAVWGRVRPACVRAGRNVKILDYRDPLPGLLEELS